MPCCDDVSIFSKDNNRTLTVAQCLPDDDRSPRSNGRIAVNNHDRGGIRDWAGRGFGTVPTVPTVPIVVAVCGLWLVAHWAVAGAGERFGSERETNGAIFFRKKTP